MRRLRTKLTYANVISTLCLILLVAGGTAYAATRLPKNSVGARQLKKGAVTPAKLSKATTTALAGPRGPQGPKGEAGSTGQRGEQGPAGPSAAYSTFHDFGIEIHNSSENPHTYGTLGNLPAGSYAITATFGAFSEITTLSLLVCELHAGSDSDSRSVSIGKGSGDAWYASVSMQVVHAFASAGSVTLSCGLGQSGPITIDDIKITATRVGEVSNTPF